MSLRQLCEDKGFSMTDISNTTGISLVYLSNLNTGKKCNPGGIVIQQISEALKVSADEVLKAIRG